jgi:hypothetical protein
VYANRLQGVLGTTTGKHMARQSGTWRWQAKLLVSLLLLYHMSAILAGALGGPPSSPLQQRAAALFRRYFGFVNQGYAYRYYARLDTTVDVHSPHPWSTPVVTLEMEFAGPQGVRQEVVRLPGRERVWPRLRFQRQLDLAYHVTSDPRWAGSYARYVCKKFGCSKVTVYTQEHQIPDLAAVRAAASGLGEPVDLEADSTYAHRLKLGEFRCEDF